MGEVLGRLDQAGLTLNVSKCTYVRTEILFLGYLVDEKGIRPLPERVQPILEYSKPSDVQACSISIGGTFPRQGTYSAGYKQS